MELLANHAFFNNNSNNNNHPSNNLFALNLLNNNNKYMHSRIGGDSPKTPVMSTPSSPVNSHYNAAISTLGWNRDKVVGESVILNPILSQFISNQSFQERHQQLLFQHQQRLQQQQQQQQQQQSLIKQQMPPSLEVVGESRKRSREGSIHLLDEKTIANSILDESASASTNGATTDVVESPTNSNSSSKRQRKLNKKVLSVLESSSTDDEESASSSSPKQVINKDRASNKSSLYCGVSKCIKDGRWQARIRVGKEVKYLGRFQTEEMAARSYDAAFIIVHGKEAEGLNFKDSIQMFDEEFMKERCKTLTATEDPLQIALASCIRLKSPSINIDFNNNANINIAKSMNDKQIQENGSIPMKRKYTKRINNKVNLTPALVLPGPAISSATTILSIENESPKMETPTNKIKTSSTLTTTIDIENPMMVILESASTNDIMAAYDLLILKQINFRS